MAEPVWRKCQANSGNNFGDARMTTREDWQFRSEYLEQQANYLDARAAAMQDEARRYRELAEQAATHVSNGDQP